jgi:hypothetical protein
MFKFGKKRPREQARDQHLSDKLAQLLAILRPDKTPNVNSLWQVTKDIPILSLNIKFFGYDLATKLAAALPVRTDLKPRHVGLKSKPSTQQDMESDWIAYWLSQLKAPVVFHRKLWEFGYVLQAIYEHGFLKEGFSGVGFGCGLEPLPSLFASFGMKVTVTDLAPDEQTASGWATTHQHLGLLENAFHSNLVNREKFDANVSLRWVDMNAIPDDLVGHDFCWSICALEHLGSIQKGLNFIENSLRILRPGGLAVHTTEFNFLSDEKTIDDWGTVLFQKKHFRELHDRLMAQGHEVAPLDFNVGSKPMDKFIDIPPYVHDWPDNMREQWGNGHNHLKLSVDGFATTCFGVIIRKRP